MPGKSDIGGVNVGGLLYLATTLVVAMFPIILLLLLGRRGLPPGESDPGSDGGGGKGPKRPPEPPLPPRGGVPLDDAEPARIRLRDHGRLADRVRTRERRPTREPNRTPVRTSAPHAGPPGRSHSGP